MYTLSEILAGKWANRLYTIFGVVMWTWVGVPGSAIIDPGRRFFGRVVRWAMSNGIS